LAILILTVGGEGDSLPLFKGPCATTIIVSALFGRAGRWGAVSISARDRTCMKAVAKRRCWVAKGGVKIGTY
jgi:hypothetical protein